MKKENYGLSELRLFYFQNDNGRINHIKLGSPYNFFAMLDVGWAHFSTPYTDITLYPGELLYIPKGLVYTSSWHGEGGCRFYSLGFTFRHFSENARFSLQKLPSETVCAFGIKKEHFSSVVHGNPPVRAAEEWPLLALFYRLYSTAAPLLASNASRTLDEHIRPALHHLEKDPTAACDVPTLARLCGMSLSGFYAAFKQATDTTPTAYKNLLRARLAVTLLTNTNMTVEEIAARVGCSTPSYLRRILADTLGKTPKAIRREKETM